MVHPGLPLEVLAQPPALLLLPPQVPEEPRPGAQAARSRVEQGLQEAVQDAAADAAAAAAAAGEVCKQRRRKKGQSVLDIACTPVHV